MKYGLISFFAFLFSCSIYAQSLEVSDIYSNLPLIVINTNGQTIVDEPKIKADIKIIYKGVSALNHYADSGNIYDGLCGIEYRGTYSQTLPQKPFGFETRDSLGNNNNVSLLDMPAENDWILLANYNDKVFMRNTLAFHLFEKMGHYAPRTRICEVIVNDTYEGIYIFTEKIKRDKNRVDIARLDEDDNAGDSLTGGYIFKTDYYHETDSWLSAYSPIDHPGSRVYFVYEYPEPDLIDSFQMNYIQEFVNTCETILYGDNFKDPQLGYRAYIDTKSFIDYFIIGELSRNIDAYKKSALFHKDRDDNGGLLKRGPVWDFDWAWKNMNNNCDIFAATNGSGWAYQVNTCDNWPVAPAWIIRLLQDKAFEDELYTRYTMLRNTILSEDYLEHYIDSVALLVNDAQARHYKRWPILGFNVGTPEVDYQPSSYEGEIFKFKSWIATRLSWLDANMPGELIVSNTPGLNDDQFIFRLFPNPVRDFLFIESDQPILKVEILNTAGMIMRSLMIEGCYSSALDVNGLNPGIYVVRTTFENNAIVVRRIVVE
ncbi:MAG: CotH kinase family protein [Bacteroidales bacterium]|nr:CotH kinase family protein [Bacteroidales bacterium]MBN2763734.1 CotH kinase family protein [Bacteroidales bacterium]